jgi:hypothetical protein
MPDTLTDRRRRHNLQLTEQVFGHDEGYFVIARSEATKQSILSLLHDGLLRFARNDGFHGNPPCVST